MPYKSEDLWASGKPEPPLRDNILQFLEENSDQYYTAGEVAEHAFYLEDFEEVVQDLPESYIDKALNERFRFSLKAELLLERLVEDGFIEKRSIRVSDSIDVAIDDHPDVFPDDAPPSDFLGARTVCYRFIQE